MTKHSGKELTGLPDSRGVVEQLTRLGFEIVMEPTESTVQLRVSGRVRPPRLPTWKLAVENLCVAARRAQWTVDVSQHHFIPEPMAKLVMSGDEPINGDHLRFAWRIIFQAAKIADYYDEIVDLLGRVNPPRQEIMQVTLAAPPNRNQLVKGKGARPVSGTMLSGPIK